MSNRDVDLIDVVLISFIVSAVISLLAIHLLPYNPTNPAFSTSEYEYEVSFSDGCGDVSSFVFFTNDLVIEVDKVLIRNSIREFNDVYDFVDSFEVRLSDSCGLATSN
jgi:hypothetical protein